MAGFVAILATAGSRPVLPEELDAFAGAYEAVRGAASTRKLAGDDRVRVAVLDAPARAGHVDDDGDGAWVAAVGSLRGGPPRAGVALETLDGQFGLVSHDPGARCATVATDPFGMQAVYVAQADGRTFAATSLLALARHLRLAPSRAGLLTFLRSGYHFGTLTGWEGAQRLEPGTALRVRDGRPVTERYWLPEVDRSVRALDLQDAVSRCIAAALDAMAGYRPGRPVWADLTGGFDSRLLALLAERSGRDFITATNGGDDSLDVRLARDLASRAGWPWTQLVLPDDFPERVAPLVEAAVGWGDGNLDALQLAEVLWGHERKAQERPDLLTGGGGEHYRDYPWLTEFLRAGRSTEVNYDNWIGMRMLGAVDTSVLADDPTEMVRADFRARSRAWADQWPGAPNTTKLDMLYAYKSVGHFGAYQSAVGGTIDAALPFYWRPMFCTAISVHHRHRTFHRLMRHMMERLDPRLAAVQTETGGPAVPFRLGNQREFIPFYRRRVRGAVNKITQQLPGPTLFTPRGPEGSPVGAEARRRVTAALVAQGQLDPARMRTGRLYRKDALAALVTRAMAPGGELTPMLRRIITCELAVEAADAGLD